jgi:tripartite-type tricarboxylate transporter receptor subunit TctC
MTTRRFPARPVRLIVTGGAGGGLDITARLIGQWLSERLGEQFIVEDRPGGGGNIGTEACGHEDAGGTDSRHIVSQPRADGGKSRASPGRLGRGALKDGRPGQMTQVAAAKAAS